MSDLTLVIGNKRYSSWSLRPWMLLRHIGVPFREVRIPLYAEGSKALLRGYSPSGKVPALIDGDVTVWDSLAICEYLAERFPDARCWPGDRRARAQARAVSAEMHSGFPALRHELSMQADGPRRGVVPTPAAWAEIDRIVESWTRCRREFGAGGPWLFGRYTIADAMYAPVAVRFWAYGVELDGDAAAYAKIALEDPHLQDWLAAGRAESEILPQFEYGTKA